MPRGKYYSAEIREEARRLREQGRSLSEISAELGPRKNTLTLWLRDVEILPEQRARLEARMGGGANAYARAMAAETHTRRRLDRIEIERRKAAILLDSLTQIAHTNHIAAAMLYLAEGSKGKGAFAFANSNPAIICYWLYLLRTGFSIDESKFRLRLMIRADQDMEEVRVYWSHLTQIYNCMPVYVDPRTIGKSPTYADYKGVCTVYYNDLSIRRYLDAVAHGMMERSTETSGASE